MAFADSGGTSIYYDERGKGEPTILCLPGWCVHSATFVPLAERLSAQHRVLAMDWRGHGGSQAPSRDFGYPELLADALAVIEASGAQSVVPVAQSHGGWVALELRRRLGERVPKMIFTSWYLFDPPPPFLSALRALQDDVRWRETVGQLLTMWLSGAPATVDRHIRNEMGSHGFEMWARAGREIAAMYAREGNPIQALSRLGPAVPVLHLYAQPSAPEYFAAQESFAREHAWFTVRRLEAASHFPMLEVPEETAGVIRQFIQ